MGKGAIELASQLATASRLSTWVARSLLAMVAAGNTGVVVGVVVAGGSTASSAWPTRPLARPNLIAPSSVRSLVGACVRPSALLTI